MLPVKTKYARARTLACMHVHVHMQRKVVPPKRTRSHARADSAGKATFWCEKCIGMLQKQWAISSVRLSNSECSAIVKRALDNRQLKMFLAVPLTSLKLSSCSPKYPRLFGRMHNSYCRSSNCEDKRCKIISQQ